MAAVTGALALVLSGCTADQDQVTDPSRVLQTVDTTLTTNGAVNAISDTTISVAGKRSSSKTVDHDVQDAAGDLPLRITTQYTTDKRSGTDLADLDGYSGRVEIDVTVENLTVRSENLTYDVAGASRSTPALVGAPFSIAASTVLDGVAPDRIVTQSVDGGAATDGVVSTNASGDAVVQWGRLLAPPTSGASSTLHLVADVREFSTPAIDVAAQPGLTTDLSTSGVMNGAFGSDTDSELALQRRTIDLIAQVNEVLARAGGTITEVRTNLESTSQTLGVRTAERLQESSASLASTMQSLSGELGSLNGDLGSTVQATQSTVLQQLQQTTGSLDALLGDTSATAPAPVLKDDGCKAVPQTGAAGASVYGNLLRVSAQLEGYAEASEACKQEVTAQLAAAVGPEQPDEDSCALKENADSLTCSLFASSKSINESLIGLVTAGTAIADVLRNQNFGDASDSVTKLQTTLDGLSTTLDAYQADADPSSVTKALDVLEESSSDLSDRSDELQTALRALHARADAARSLIDGAGLPFSMERQNSAVADQLCLLATLDRISDEDAARLRGYLTAEPCAGAAQDEKLSPGPGFDTPMDARLEDQANRWQEVADGTKTEGAAEGTIGASVGNLRSQLDQLQEAIKEVRAASTTGGSNIDKTVGDLRTSIEQAQSQRTTVAEQLESVHKTQLELADRVQESFADASDSSTDALAEALRSQVRIVGKASATSRDAVVDAFDKSIAGLRTTSGEVTSDSKGTIDEQKGALQQQGSSLASAVDEQTAASLQRIDASTSASVRDVEGASTLLIGDLNRVMLDLGDRKVNGSGILGAMATSAAKSDSADYQLALASQNASGYANVRAEDVAGILLQQEQFRASLDRAATLPAFRLDVPSSATSTTLYAFRIGAER
ncbi:hypothetical protein QUG98_15455 [Curtobacterium sp. RHCJP20]|uniref:Nucleic acid-binding Zn-ribbon protein n=1 Tax=Curtobacterium subtropicum TaxID=3055138 RepID=A0ABT7TKH0_9MICO|nr:hypothetical protein [Curtobacterium subtropicum]MDM7889849.1 hypothetical protein [Curtobacterium subtropicum]